LDNANKYCDPNGMIFVNVSADKHGKNVLLKVGNSYAEGQNVDYNKFFERFYRNDTSHNNEKKSGFGIGLSIAQNLVKNFKGSLSVDWKDGNIYFTVSFKSLRQSTRSTSKQLNKTQ
ncbi:MAG: sensor histidine kinase, partial [Lactobacillus sp.]|nr:sensor histidine kinase [Lactobacillus sp.]